jgi:GMP synthase (glutamine-hydrolysing)
MAPPLPPLTTGPYKFTFTLLQERIKGAAPNAIILSGGPNSVHLEGSPRVPEGFFAWAEAEKIPILGVCYGMQV